MVALRVPFPAEASKKLRLGSLKGKIWMSPDFDAPLSDESSPTPSAPEVKPAGV
jgi:hypothetical protein